METNATASQLLSKEEAMNILRIKDDRTLLYKRRFQIIMKDDNIYFSKSELSKHLGTGFTEPFLDTIEASEYLGISEQQLLGLLLKKALPYYSFTKSKGSKRLFKKSELESFKEEPDKIYLRSHTDIANKTRLIKWLRELFLFCLNEEQLLGFLSTREKDIVKAVISEKNLDDIATELSLPRQRVRQLFDKAARRIHMYLFHYFKNILNENEYYKKKCDELAFKNKILEEAISIVSKNTGASISTIENTDEAVIAIHNLLKTKIVDLFTNIRILNGLKYQDIETLSDLVSCNKRELLHLRNFGKKSLIELEELVHSKGLEFGMDITKYGFPQK